MSEPTYLSSLASSPSTEAAIVADLAQTASDPHPLDPDLIVGITLPAGASHRVIDLEALLGTPRRKSGRLTLVDAASFGTYYAKHQQAGATAMYADVTTQRIVAVLNDASTDEPGWRDHVLTLALTKTPAWQRWVALDNQLMSQTAFAEHIEMSLPDIVTPDGATMLEIAQSFQAHTNVTFESSKLLASGQRQFVYREETTAKAGQTGTIEVPKEIELALAPFEVGEIYKVRAWLRHRQSPNDLSLGFKLDRPDDVLRSAFADVVAEVEDRTGNSVMYGTPPS